MHRRLALQSYLHECRLGSVSGDLREDVHPVEHQLGAAHGTVACFRVLALDTREQLDKPVSACGRHDCRDGVVLPLPRVSRLLQLGKLVLLPFGLDCRSARARARGPLGRRLQEACGHFERSDLLLGELA